MTYFIKKIIAERRKFAKEMGSTEFIKEYVSHILFVQDYVPSLLPEFLKVQKEINGGKKSHEEIYEIYRSMPSSIIRK